MMSEGANIVYEEITLAVVFIVCCAVMAENGLDVLAAVALRVQRLDRTKERKLNKVLDHIIVSVHREEVGDRMRCVEGRWFEKYTNKSRGAQMRSPNV